MGVVAFQLVFLVLDRWMRVSSHHPLALPRVWLCVLEKNSFGARFLFHFLSKYAGLKSFVVRCRRCVYRIVYNHMHIMCLPTVSPTPKCLTPSCAFSSMCCFVRSSFTLHSPHSISRSERYACSTGTRVCKTGGGVFDHRPPA